MAALASWCKSFLGKAAMNIRVCILTQLFVDTRFHFLRRMPRGGLHVLSYSPEAAAEFPGDCIPPHVHHQAGFALSCEEAGCGKNVVPPGRTWGGAQGLFPPLILAWGSPHCPMLPQALFYLALGNTWLFIKILYTWCCRKSIPYRKIPKRKSRWSQIETPRNIHVEWWLMSPGLVLARTRQHFS